MGIIEELIDTLKNFKIQIDEEIIERWKNLIISNSLIVESFEKLDIIQEDLEDNKFLEAAIAEKADFIISQDNHLLKLKEYLGIRIINPEEAVRLIA